MLVVKSIVIYPIKGMKGVELDSCATFEEGFENDRRYMLVDSSNKFVSQRSHSILALICTEIVEDQIRISYNGISFTFSAKEHSSKVIDVRLFDNIVSGTIVSDEVNRKFSEMIDDEVKLVKMTVSNVREKQLVKGPISTKVSFADGYPYLIAGTASLRLLNEKAERGINMDRFRPNIIIETKVPHEEDDWDSIQVGNAKLMVMGPCARCPVVTINQQTAEITKDTLKVLSSYRKEENKVFFGANTISLVNSRISIGDPVIRI